MYYFQVQTQIFVCQKEYCDFVVWTEQDMHIERFEPNEDLWEKIRDKSEKFFKQVILPELVGKWYSKPQLKICNRSLDLISSPEGGHKRVKNSKKVGKKDQKGLKSVT